MSAKRYLGTFFRGRRLYIPVLLLLLAATILGTYYLARTQYEATARIWVDKPALDNVLDPNAPSGFVVSPGQQQADKIIQLLQTDSFVASILTNTTLAGRLTNDPDRDRVIKDVRGKLSVTPLGYKHGQDHVRGERSCPLPAGGTGHDRPVSRMGPDCAGRAECD